MEKQKVETPTDESEIQMRSQGYGPSLIQAVEVPIMEPDSGFIMSNGLPWKNSFGFHLVPSQHMDQPIVFETRPPNSTEENMSVVRIDGSNAGKKVIDEFKNDSSTVSSISYAMRDPKMAVNLSRIRKVKISDVNGPETGLLFAEHNLAISMNQSDTRPGESALVTAKQCYGREGGHVTLMGNSFHIADANVKSAGSTSRQGINKAIKKTPRNKEGSNALFSGSYQDVIDALSKPVCSYTLLYEPHLVPNSRTPRKRKVNVQKGNTKTSTFQVPKSRVQSTYKNKLEKKATKKEVPYKFPTNAKSLTVTGMFDGVAVRYVSLSKKKELGGIIKGPSYLCGCQSCNYSKTLNAYEFEHHAGCKTSHPNNHIHFKNGKTMHQVVQELKNTPRTMLFDVIQTVTGSPLNQEAFSAWKDSFQAASHKLQRISGMK